MKKITNMRVIKNSKGQQIGRINMITYSKSSSIPHIEYDLDDEYHNKGIMTKELAEYLQEYKLKGHYKFIAMTEKDNLASARVLEKNNFEKFAEMPKYFIYTINTKLIK